MQQYPARAVARWFVAWAALNAADDVSNLKLQKLLYYAQGWHLGLYGAPLFIDQVEAWDHGPVVNDCYQQFKKFEDAPIVPSDQLAADPDLDSATTQFLIRIWDTYGAMSAWKLRNMTHFEPPWRETYQKGAFHKVIPVERLRVHFADAQVDTLVGPAPVVGDRHPVLLPSTLADRVRSAGTPAPPISVTIDG